MAKKSTTQKTPSRKASAKSAKKFVPAKAVANAPMKVNRRTGKMKPTTRLDLGQPGSVAIDRLPEPQRSIAQAADALIQKAVKGCTSIVKWGNPCYYQGERAFAVIYQTSKGVNLGMPGAGFDDPKNLLEGTGKKMRHVKLHDATLAKSPAVAALVKQAVKIGFEGM